MKSRVIKISIILFIIAGGFIIINAKPKKQPMAQYLNNSPYKQNIAPVSNNFITSNSEEVEQYDMVVVDGFEKVTENNYLELYYEKDSLAIAIKNKTNGFIWYSYPVDEDISSYSQTKIRNIRSAVTVELMNVFTSNNYTVLDANIVKTKVEKIDQGFKATIDFHTFKIRFDLVVKLDGPEVVIEIPRDSIEEYNPNLWKIAKESVSLFNIELYPYMGANSGRDNGYYVIPDGIGAIIELDKEPRSRRSYTHYIHGRDLGHTNRSTVPELQIQDVKPLQRITLPLFGVIDDAGNNGLMVFSEEGSQGASYNYRVKGLETDFYQTFFSYVYRKTYTQFQSRATEDNILDIPKEPFDINVKQRLFFLTGSEANYVGMAKRYRDYLEVNHNFDQEAEHKDDYPTRVELIGNEVTRGIFSNKNIATTKYRDAIDLLKLLQEDGYTNLDVSFKTYDTSKSAYRFKVLNNLGGKKGLNALLDYTEENDINFSHFLDYTYNYNHTKDSARKMNSQPLMTTNLTYMFLMRYINHTGSVIKNIKRDLKSLNKYNIDEVTLESLGDLMHTTNRNRKIVSMISNINDIETALETLKADNKSIATYTPDFFAYPYINKYLNMPVTSSELSFTDATIPLIPLILSGRVEMYSNYLNFIENEEQYLLRLVEYGINPSYIMTTENTYELQYTNSSNVFISNYDSLKVRMNRYDETIKEALDAINGTELTNHEYIGNGIAKSTFANGVVIVLNYTKDDFVYQGKTIKSNGYGIL